MDVLFVVLPFADVHHPAIGVSLLSAKLAELEIESSVYYPNIDLAEWIGADLYAWIAERSDQHLLDPCMPAVSLAGEWFFADTVFDNIPSEQEYVSKFLANSPSSRPYVPQILEARHYRNRFIDHCVREIIGRSPRVVGFTSTFHQNCACLSVAKGLKQQPNPPVVILGGANCEGIMGMQLLASFPWIDHVCTGEGDVAVPQFLEGLLKNREAPPVPGILRQCGGVQEVSIPQAVRRMDDLPIPDYSSYFERISRSTIKDKIDPRLLMESSRGCWWGEKQHCTFCGLNGETMVYRSKSPERVRRELGEMIEKYEVNRIDTVDNILDLKYLRNLFPELAKPGPKANLFYETKANLRFEQMRILRHGGVWAIQPGIESFSNEVLRLMRKGCTGLTNIQFLRWAEELEMAVVWNLIFGFPRESPSEYYRMAELLPLLTHLQTPVFCVRVRMDRFSPLYFEGERLGVQGRRPMPAYSYVYPLVETDLDNLSYFFEFDYADGRDPSTYATPLLQAVDNWAAECKGGRPRLDLFNAGDVVLISDTRACTVTNTHVLSGLRAAVCLACDSAHTPGALAGSLGLTEDQVRAELDALSAAKLMVEMEGSYLSLPVIRTRQSLPAKLEKYLEVDPVPIEKSILSLPRNPFGS